MTEPLRRSASPRLAAAAAVAAGGFVAGFVFGRAEYPAAAAPFAVLVLIGALGGRRPTCAVHVRATPSRLVEGDELTLDVAADVRGASHVELAIPVSGPVPPSSSPAWSRRTHRPISVREPVRTTSWGRVTIGAPFVRAWSPLALVSWEGAVGAATTVPVQPATATLRALLVAHEPRASAGSHPSRARGDGWTFADVRPYRPGDRLRQINWRATARFAEPWVNERHLDRSADLVLLIDALADSPAADTSALVPLVRATWAIANAHLRANDRVGLLVFGGTIGWVAAGSGLRAQAALFERLLAVEPGWTAAQRSVAFVPRSVLPAGADVMVLSALHDERVVLAAAELRRRGYSVSALVMRQALALDDDPLAHTAARLWDLEIDRRTAELERAGVATTLWAAEDGVDAAVLAVGRRRQAIRR